MQKPQISDLIKYRLPDWLLDKTQFTKFLEYYYEWMDKKGNPLEFLRNLVEYIDVDQTSDEFVDLIIGKILNFIPADATIDRVILIKNVKNFIKSKGTNESLDFIMKAVYGEEAYRVNMSDKVLRASDNEYKQDAYISIQVDFENDFYQCIGSYLVQQKNQATLKIEEVSINASDDGRVFHTIKFDPRYINGEFEIGSKVRAAKRYVDPTFIEIYDYSKAVSFDTASKTIRLISEKKLNLYNGAFIIKLGNGFKGVVSHVSQYYITSDYLHDYSIVLSGYTLDDIISTNDELYLCASADVDSHITKLDFSYGTVTECIGDFEYNSPASGYYLNLPVEVRGGTGNGCDAYIGECTTGSVDSVIVLDGGFNYRVGDPVIVSDLDAGGSGFSGYVSDVDGTGCELIPTMQIDQVMIEDGGYGYKVGDVLAVSHLLNKTSNTPILLTVATVGNESFATLKGFKIINSGKGYRMARATLVPYTDITVVNGVITNSQATISPISGISADHYTYNNILPEQNSVNASVLNYSDSIIDVKINTFPTPSALLGNSSGNGENNAWLVYNGFGAELIATVSSGSISNISISKSGYAYISPFVTVSDASGAGAAIKVLKNQVGQITGFSILSGGSGYSANPVLTISDASGSGFIAKAICNNTTLGTITGFSVLSDAEKGEFVELPAASYNIPYSSVNTLGNSAKISLTFKLKRVSIAAQGKGYISEFDVFYCNGVSGSNVITTTKNFNNVREGMYVYGANVPLRTKVLQVHTVSNVNIKHTTLTLTKNLSGDLTNQTLTFDPNTVIGAGNSASGLELYPVIESGQLVNVAITNSGSGYPTASTIYFTGGTSQASAKLKIIGGKVYEVDMITYGTGYTNTNFGYYVNSELDVAYQSDAEFKLSVGGSGSILSVNILSGGYGYVNDSSTKLYIDGSYITPANLSIDISTSVDIINVIDKGNVNAFLVSPTDNWQNVIDNTNNIQTVLYKSSSISGGVDGVISYFITPTGKLATDKKGNPWLWISNPGYNYTNPTVTIGDGTGLKPKILLGCSRKINNISVIDGGTGYSSNTKINIVGAGHGCQVSPVVDGYGGISSIELLNTNYTNQNYLSAPLLKVEDKAFAGKISEVKVVSGGNGFRKFPTLSCEVFSTQIVADRYWGGSDWTYTGSGGYITEIVGVSASRQLPAIGAKLITTSNSIGAVKSINQTKFGYGYNEIPDVLFPVAVVVDNINNFKINESVSNTGKVFRNIGNYLVKIESFGSMDDTNMYMVPTTIVTFTMVDSPYEYGIHPNQVITITGNTARYNYNVAGQSFVVLEVNIANKSFIASTSKVVPIGTYTISDGYSKLETDAVLTEKSAKILSIDVTRNMMWLTNVDNVYYYSEDINFVAEGIIGDDVHAGKEIISEHFMQMSENKKIIGHKSNATANILWMNRAYVLPIQTSIGKTKKAFTSGRGLLNSADVKLTNSENIQDFSFEVHTGYSVDLYSKLLKETVHPAGYHLSGVIDDVTDTSLFEENILTLDLPLTDSGKSGDYVLLTIFGVIMSLELVRNGEYTTKNIYKKRMRENFIALDNSVPIKNGQISRFDLWKYPDTPVWHVKAENEDADFHIWGTATIPPRVNIAQHSKTCTYSQTSNTITFSAIDHGLKYGDYVSVLDAKEYINKGKFDIRSSIHFNLDDIVYDTSVQNKWYKCILAHTSTGTPMATSPQPNVDYVHWVEVEGNIRGKPMMVTGVANSDSFSVTSPHSIDFVESVPRHYRKDFDYGYVGTYVRQDAPNRHLINVTKNNHNLVAGVHSWLYSSVVAEDDTNVGDFSVVAGASIATILLIGHGLSDGDSVYISFNLYGTIAKITPNDGEYVISNSSTNTFQVSLVSSLVEAVSGYVVLPSNPESIGIYLNVHDVIDQNTFVVNTRSNGFAYQPGKTFRYWKAVDVKPKYADMTYVRKVSFILDGINIVINNLSNKHTLQKGNIIMLMFGSNVKYAKIINKTSTTITVKNDGILESDSLDIAFSFDQADSPELAYHSLQNHTY